MTYYIGKCKKENCEKEAIYNYKNHLVGIRCLEHIETGMINIKHKVMHIRGSFFAILGS